MVVEKKEDKKEEAKEEAKVITRTVAECLSASSIDDVNVKGGFSIKGRIIASQEPRQAKTGNYFTSFEIVDSEGQSISATLWGKSAVYLNDGDDVEMKKCIVKVYQNARQISGFFPISAMPNKNPLPVAKKKVAINNKENYWQERYNWDVQNAKNIERLHLHNLKKDAFVIASTEINTQIDAGWFNLEEIKREEVVEAVNERAREIYAELIEEKEEAKKDE